MIFEINIEEDITPDIVIIWDCADATINHVFKYSPSLLKKYDSCLVCNIFLSVK